MASQSNLDVGPARPDPVMTAVSVTVVLPTSNSARQLPYLLAVMPREIAELIVVDGHSVDASVEVARQCWPGVRIVQQSGRGKGNALSCGFLEARGDIIVMLDADGSTDPAEIPRFVAALITGADVAKGTRLMPPHLGHRMRGDLINWLWSANYGDPCHSSGAFWRRCLPELQGRRRWYAHRQPINLRIARSDLHVVEVPSLQGRRSVGAMSCLVQ
jgi:glycosyltransferase involved in cell wall biosynthesis